MKSRLDSFRFACRGIVTLAATQFNARIHLAVLAAVTAAGFILEISATEWCLVILASATVISMEAMNSALEFLADHTAPEWHHRVGKAKDMAAAAVLITSAGAAAVGIIVFLPHILNIL